MDRVAREHILDNIRHAIPTSRPRLTAELEDLERQHGGPITLRQFLSDAMLELEDLYRRSSGGWSWTDLRRLAGHDIPVEGPDEKKLLRALPRLLHLDDPTRTGLYARVLTSPRPPQVEKLSPQQQRLLAMLHFDLRGPTDKWPSLDASFADLWRYTAVRAELTELLALLDERATNNPVHSPLPLRNILFVGGRYSREEIIAAFGALDPARPAPPREGVWFHKPTQTDVLFVTLTKAEKHFSPTTRYEDYPVSRDLFHWQSQSTTATESEVGRRYLAQRETGSNVLLFVRKAKKDARGVTMPYTHLGLADYVSHTGSRPISITWRLRQPMTREQFEEARIAAG